MKQFVTLLFLLIFFITSYSQDLRIKNNPYDNAPEYIKSSVQFNRERWFYEQRMYPDNFIPEGAYENAMRQRNEIRNSQGFYFPNTVTWTNIGPTPGYYFSYGNICGRIPAVIYDPNNPNVIYIGAAFGGVWKSVNGGNTWTPLTDWEISLSSGSIAVDFSNSNIVYYGTGEATYSGTSYYGRGLLKSTNGGLNWTSYRNGLPNSTYFSRIVIRPYHFNEIFGALGTSGLYKSTDAGQNWTQLISGRCDDIVFTSSGDTAYITGSGTGYRKSTNGGQTFDVIGGISMLERNHIAICKSAPNVLYIAIYGSSNVNVFKSTNAGLNYTQVVTNLSGSSQAWYDFFMHVNPVDPNYAYVGAIDVWRTTDGGASFVNITNAYGTGVVHPDQHNMAFNPVNPDELVAANDGGIWKSTNRGTTWTNLNSNLSITQFYRMTSDPNNAAHLLGGTQDNGTQRTTGTINWTAAFGGDGGEVCFQPNNSYYVLGETQNNGLRRSVDNGVTWTSATTGLSGSGAWVAPIVAHPDSVEIFYTARQQVFKSTNMGSSWVAISSGTSGTIREMDICKANKNYMYATSGGNVYKSTDGGYSFSPATSGLPGRTVTSIHFHPDSVNTAVVSISGFGAGKVYKTTNNGTNWINISGNMPDVPVNDVMIYYPGYQTSILLAATDVGVFITTNWGNTWVELADGLPNTVSMHLDYNLAGNKIRIGTHGRGTYSITGYLTGITNYHNEIPKDFCLYQNYPNPFNPATRIKFSIPNIPVIARNGVTKQSQSVSLVVYDLLGKEISVLVNQNLNPGTYEVTFDAGKLTSGTYFYKLTAGDFSETKKMILLR